MQYEQNKCDGTKNIGKGNVAWQKARYINVVDNVNLCEISYRQFK